jgi:uncharacterized protein YkwD
VSPPRPQPPRASDSGWEALCRTAALVRTEPGRRRGRRRLPGAALVIGALLGAAVFAGTHWGGQPVGADSTADAQLFALTNQDRTSNGVAALAENSTLDAIGEAAPYSGCSGAGTIDGRAQDMINRDYFSHQIPPCEEYVWPMMSAFGIDYQSAGENIGWESGYGGGTQSANQVNTDFMNSPDHRANILNSNYTELGTGSASAASGWTYASGEGPFSDVWMFAEEFAQVGSPPPPPTQPSTPAPTQSPTSPPTQSSTPPPVQTTAPTPTPTPPPTPSPTPAPTPSPTAAPTAAPTPGPPLPAYDVSGQGLISDTIEETLEAFLFD